MRIERLDLLRYGKFTGKSVSLPKAVRDFHLIIGPNEAGKSTLRNAIQDLLFGIEIKSRYDFIHPHKEMLVGALIEQGGAQLDFIRSYVRTKVSAKTLHHADGTLLPDNALLPFTGPVDRIFFDRMFGLNHERLVSGGQLMLSASDDIGQILFQAAAGIGSLGEIRDKLEAEADKLWAKRKSGDREYYIASAELAQAEAALKQATVRTKDWQEASEKVDQIAGDLSLAQAQYRSLETERVRLERVRRVAPVLTRLDELDGELTELGTVVSLPENAAAQLARSEHDIAIASQSLTLFGQQLSALQEKLSAINPDEFILARAQDIEALSAMRQQLRNHESDIARCEDEIRIWSQTLDEYARQLGWTEQGEEALTQRLPGKLVRSALDNLVRRHEVLALALANAEEAQASRVEEAKAVDAEIAALNRVDIPAALTCALANAKSLGNTIAQLAHLEAQLGKSGRELDALSHHLGEFNPSIARLRTLLPPGQDETNALIMHRRDLERTLSVNNEQLAGINAAIEALRLDISQYKSAHHPVTLADVLQRRGTRDLAWQSIRTGERPLAESATGYEHEVKQADLLADQRHDKVQEETELQSRIDRQAQLQQQSDSLDARSIQSMQAIARFDAEWLARMNAIGLAGMPLLRVSDWREARERVLNACDALTEAQVARDDFVANVSRARVALAEAMQSTGAQRQNLNLPELILLADERVAVLTRDSAKYDALTGQKIRAEAATPDLHRRLARARGELDSWRVELEANLLSAHLPTEAGIGAIEGALDLFVHMEQLLRKIGGIRVDRIDAMRRDLINFAGAAKSLADSVSPGMANKSAGEIVLAFADALKQAQAASCELARLRAEFDKVTREERAAADTIAQARAALLPLLNLSGATDNDGLRAAIGQSDRLRILRAESDPLKVQLLQAGDGLTRDALYAEFLIIDVDSIAPRLSEIKFQLDEVVSQQNRLSAGQSTAITELGKIAGQDEAARAESQRQEALARMSNAAERYIKVCTAAKLLRWSIERFRESRQGPMLACAGDIFSGLTQGAFVRLAVDYESEPLKLSGQRADGELVEIDGMSEGTRDQLYLALRLAALEQHLQHTIALPFIADDLFINYDDARACAGFTALSGLAEMTQVIFLSHHAHLIPVAQQVFGQELNVINLFDHPMG